MDVSKSCRTRHGKSVPWNAGYLCAKSKKRRPKNTIVVDGKGRRNDGDIDIINEKTLFDPTARQQHIESEDLVFNNVRYRIPEKSIKLDFIDRIHSGHKRKAEEAFEFDSSLSPAPSSLPSTSKDMDDIPAAESASTDYARRKSDQLWVSKMHCLLHV